MKLNDQPGNFTGPGEIRFVRLLPGPIERVWTYLTDPEKRGRWLAPGTTDLRVGGMIELRFKHANLTPHAEEIPDKYKEMCAEGGSGCNVDGKILRCEPPRVLAYTWGELDGSASEVTFELTAEGPGVRLVLTHRKLGDNRDQLLSVSAGWHTHLAILLAKLDERVPPPFWSTHTALELEYGRALDAAAPAKA